MFVKNPVKNKDHQLASSFIYFKTVQFEAAVSTGTINKMQCGKIESETSPMFQKICNKIVEKLNENECEKFKALESDEERIRFIYSFANTLPIVLKDSGKNFEEAQQKKVKGNGFFAKKEYEPALRAYNEGITKCPQNDGNNLGLK